MLLDFQDTLGSDISCDLSEFPVEVRCLKIAPGFIPVDNDIFNEIVRRTPKFKLEPVSGGNAIFYDIIVFEINFVNSSAEDRAKHITADSRTFVDNRKQVEGSSEIKNERTVAWAPFDPEKPAGKGMMVYCEPGNRLFGCILDDYQNKIGTPHIFLHSKLPEQILLSNTLE